MCKIWPNEEAKDDGDVVEDEEGPFEAAVKAESGRVLAKDQPSHQVQAISQGKH